MTQPTANFTERDAMDKNDLLIQLRTRKLSALIYDARIASDRSIKDCAEAICVSRYAYKAFESGDQSPTLPQLEALGEYLDIPMDHFWGNESLSEVPQGKETAEVEAYVTERNQEILATLRQARDEAGISLKQLAEESGIKRSTLGRYELGKEAIPIPQLEVLANCLEIDLRQFFNQSNTMKQQRIDQDALSGFLELPEELQEFIAKPINRSYLELAHRLSTLSVEKLRLVAEGLLEITY
jgi:transcriptional regulator with XRE-family HTH domain